MQKSNKIKLIEMILKNIGWEKMHFIVKIYLYVVLQKISRLICFYGYH